MSAVPDPANADQVAYWSGPTGTKWAARQVEIDGIFAPLTEALLAAAAPREGESVLDVGCGCGAMVLAVADRIGPAGTVTGLDVSEPMLAVARHRAAAAGYVQATLVEADASRYPLALGSIDLIVSRLGVMFFEDPAGAFAHLRAALKPDGRLAFVCWQALDENAWFSVPVEAVTPLMEPQPPADPLAPGPFAFADRERLRSVLEAAGFTAIDIAHTALRLPLGDRSAATNFLGQVGAAARLLKEAAPDVVERGHAAIAAAIAPFDGPGGVVMPAAVWVVTARPGAVSEPARTT